MIDYIDVNFFAQVVCCYLLNDHKSIYIFFYLTLTFLPIAINWTSNIIYLFCRKKISNQAQFLNCFERTCYQSQFTFNQNLTLALHGVYQINKILKKMKKKSKSNGEINFLLEKEKIVLVICLKGKSGKFAKMIFYFLK